MSAVDNGISVREIAHFLLKSGADFGKDATILRVSSLATAGPDSVVFAGSPAALQAALATSAGLILALEHVSSEARVIGVMNPRQAFARVYDRFFRPRTVASVHPTATVETGVQMGEGCVIAAGAVIEEGVRMGDGCRIGPKVVLHRGTTLGNRVRVQAGAVLGSDGFGYVPVGSGYLGFPQIGTLEIGDDVEIGAGTTIDRGALEATIIGRGSKIDNLVHIGHNCRVGEDVLIAAQVGIAGSSVVGDRAILGGQVGIGEHAYLGEGVILGGQAGVPSHKRLEGAGVIFWGTPPQPLREHLRDLARLRRG